MNASFFLEQLKHYVQASRVHKAGQAFLLFYCSTPVGFPWCAWPRVVRRLEGRHFIDMMSLHRGCPSFWKRGEGHLTLGHKRLGRRG